VASVRDPRGQKRHTMAIRQPGPGAGRRREDDGTTNVTDDGAAWIQAAPSR
jgi:hypothetical protein